MFTALNTWTTLHNTAGVCARMHACVGACVRVYVRVRVCVLACHILQIAVCHGVKVFWMCPNHFVSIAETDRGAVGQSGVGVFEWVIPNSDCVRLQRHGWMAWFSLHLRFSLWLPSPLSVFSGSLSLSLLFQTFSPSPLPESFLVHCVCLSRSTFSLPLWLSVSPVLSPRRCVFLLLLYQCRSNSFTGMMETCCCQRRLHKSHIYYRSYTKVQHMQFVIFWCSTDPLFGEFNSACESLRLWQAARGSAVPPPACFLFWGWRSSHGYLSFCWNLLLKRTSHSGGGRASLHPSTTSTLLSG